MARQDQRMPTDQPVGPPTRQSRKAADGAVVRAWEVLRRTSAASGPGTARELRTGQVSGTAQPAGLPVNRPALSCPATVSGAPAELSCRCRDGSPRVPVGATRSLGRVGGGHRPCTGLTALPGSCRSWPAICRGLAPTRIGTLRGTGRTARTRWAFTARPPLVLGGLVMRRLGLDKVPGAGSTGTDDPHPSFQTCLLYTSPSPRDLSTPRMPSSA